MPRRLPDSSRGGSTSCHWAKVVPHRALSWSKDSTCRAEGPGGGGDTHQLSVNGHMR